ncbi:B3 DNA binding domain [Macleaya cordata]|uniref:B3 DNA binding domain n=1 Tax=Macleaya cordata TaxID=56857 RepID=A0A200Q6H7_MACCD|nr:B3 DNA binding domain [Macleaya cordata]
MASKICMNVLCGSKSSIQWKKGWKLRSGGSATLCDKCGSVYEQLIFCDTFHLKETGWRGCSSCGKRLHCGCIASKSFLELLDDGGVECISCLRSSEFSYIRRDEEPNGCGTWSADNVGETQSTSLGNKIDGIDREKLMYFGISMEGDRQINLLQSQKDDTNGSLRQIKREQVMSPIGDVRSTGFSNLERAFIGSLGQNCLSMTLGSPSGTPNLALRVPGVLVDPREQNKLASPFQQGPKSCHVAPKPLKIGPGSGSGSEASKDVLPQVRVARPPVEGRGRTQLLPRYWPKITDQELQQIAGDSNSTIVPLFEKVLSASDAGRIGRLVLPKACAEAYFPRISQPEGLPIRIQDVKGKDWVFQFRFWPNNNSRMYVLEGVTPCIQSMQLQAGDTVTFSRIDPEGKLLMGFRKASNPVTMQQENHISAASNGTLPNENFVSGVIENQPVVSGYSSRLRSLKGSTGPQLSAVSEHLNSANGDISWRKTEEHAGWPSEGLPMQPLLVPEKKRSRNIGSKSKRLLMDTEDALELKLTWEEAQDLLRPPPTVKPSIVKIEDHEFEEYEEPPVFGKKTIFTARPSGGQDQWAQCDSCSRWRRMPADVLLPPKWTCVDNAWDPERCSCSAPDEMSPKELDNFLRLNLDVKRRRVTASHRQECEPSALDALATVAVLGDNGGDPGVPSVATTTRHPRHRPGCTCIVCIQPPSGKGPKHKPTCTCNVCMTVKRRFETLMMRKKKRQEHAVEIAQKKPNISWGPPNKDEVEGESVSRCKMLPLDPRDGEARPSDEFETGGGRSKTFADQATEINMGQIDLNCDPDRDQVELPQPRSSSMPVSMTSLVKVATLPLDTYLKQNGLTSLTCNHQASLSSHAAVPQEVSSRDNEGRPPPDENDVTLVQEREMEGGNEGHCVQDQTTDDANLGSIQSLQASYNLKSEKKSLDDDIGSLQ